MIEVLAKQLKLPLLAGFEQNISKEKDFADNLLHLLQLETLEKERRGIERRTRTAGFPYIRVLDAFEFATKRLPRLDRNQVYELAECRYITEKRNVIAIGNSGTGKTFIAIALGLEAIPQGFHRAFQEGVRSGQPADRGPERGAPVSLHQIVEHLPAFSM